MLNLMMGAIMLVCFGILVATLWTLGILGTAALAIAVVCSYAVGYIFKESW